MNHLKTPLIFLIATTVLSGCTEKNKWELTWSEEFENSGKPNEASWDYEIGHIRNNELQYYTDQIQNVRVEDGHCIIVAQLP